MALEVTQTVNVFHPAHAKNTTRAILGDENSTTACDGARIELAHQEKKAMQEEKNAIGMHWNSTNILLMPQPQRPIEAANNFGIPKHALNTCLSQGATDMYL